MQRAKCSVHSAVRSAQCTERQALGTPHLAPGASTVHVAPCTLHVHAPVSLLVAALVLPLVAAACGKTVGATMDDATITTRVKSALLNDPNVGALRIDVSTTAGVVTLSGSVKSSGEADRAVQIARQVPGVKDVKSALAVGGQGLAPGAGIATSTPPRGSSFH